MTYYKERGITFPAKYIARSNLELMKTFQIRDDDIVIISYPKTGTYWTHQLVKQILATEGIKDEVYLADHPNYIAFTWPRKGGIVMAEVLKSAPSPRVLTTHLTPEFLPPGLLGSKAKILVVMRNPKDAAVSYFHFCQKTPGLKTPESWDNFCEEFLSGNVPWGPFYDHILAYWNLKDHYDILFLKYEDMKKDLSAEVRKLSTFLGRPLSEEAVQAVTSATQFDSMKRAIGEDYGSLMRKGMIGDWKNYFSPEQSRAFDEQYHERLSNTGLEFEFE